MKRMTAGDLQALELLMQTTPGFEHFDSGADGILPECRSCRFHRPLLMSRESQKIYKIFCRILP